MDFFEWIDRYRAGLPPRWHGIGLGFCFLASLLARNSNPGRGVGVAPGAFAAVFVGFCHASVFAEPATGYLPISAWSKETMCFVLFLFLVRWI